VEGRNRRGQSPSELVAAAGSARPNSQDRKIGGNQQHSNKTNRGFRFTMMQKCVTAYKAVSRVRVEIADGKVPVNLLSLLSLQTTDRPVEIRRCTPQAAKLRFTHTMMTNDAGFIHKSERAESRNPVVRDGSLKLVEIKFPVGENGSPNRTSLDGLDVSASDLGCGCVAPCQRCSMVLIRA
jgi:hypothetical protein